MGRGLMDGLARGFGDIADLVSALVALLAAVALVCLF